MSIGERERQGQARIADFERQLEGAKAALKCQVCGELKAYTAICFDCLGEDVEEIARWHREVELSDGDGTSDICSQCHTGWPCDAIKALKLLAEAQTERDDWRATAELCQDEDAKSAIIESQQERMKELAQRIMDEHNRAQVDRDRYKALAERFATSLHYKDAHGITFKDCPYRICQEARDAIEEVGEKR